MRAWRPESDGRYRLRNEARCKALTENDTGKYTMPRLSSHDLDGLVACITGAGQGLGAEIAKRLVRHGARVGLGDIGVDKVVQVAKELSATGSHTIAIPLDVRSKESFQQARKTIVDRWSHVDVLVNCAAISKRTPLFDISADEFDDVLAVNLKGVFLGCQVFGELMKAQGFGRIINLTSVAGQTGGSGTGAHYAASKAGIVVLTKLFAKELAAVGVTVNAVAPGPISSSRIEALPSDTLSRMLAQVPVGRFGTYAEVSEVVAFLASRSAGFVTGATWDINGGMFMR